MAATVSSSLSNSPSPRWTRNGSIPTIADITKERVRRVIKKLNDEDAGKLDSDGDEQSGPWLPRLQAGRVQLQALERRRCPTTPPRWSEQLELHVDHIREGRTRRRHPLRNPAQERLPAHHAGGDAELAGKTVYSVAGGALLICLERELTLELIRAMAEQKPERVVCLDEGFAGNDQLKANAVQIFKTKGITSFKTV